MVLVVHCVQMVTISSKEIQPPILNVYNVPLEHSLPMAMRVRYVRWVRFPPLGHLSVKYVRMGKSILVSIRAPIAPLASLHRLVWIVPIVPLESTRWRELLPVRRAHLERGPLKWD